MGWYKSIFRGFNITIDNKQNIDKVLLEQELTNISEMFRKKLYVKNEFENDIRDYGVYVFIKARTKASSVRILEHLSLCGIRADLITTKTVKKIKASHKLALISDEKPWVSYDNGKTKIELQLLDDLI